MGKLERGFTLTELMIGVAIIGLLAAIAYPSYLKQVQKGNRSDAKVLLSEVAQRLQRCFTANGRYNPAEDVCAVVDDIQSEAGILSNEGFYVARTVADADLAAATYLITVVPVAGERQANDLECARFTLSQTGVREAFNDDGDVNTVNCW